MDDVLLEAICQLFKERGDLVETSGEKPRLRSFVAGSRAVRSKLSKNKLRDLAIAAGIPGPDSGEPGAWQDSDAERVLVVAFTDEGIDRHGTIFPAEDWTFDNYLRNPAVFLNHWGEVPIGTTLLIEEKRVVGVDGKKRRGYAAHILFSREELNPQAEIAFRNVVAGRLRGASHSFDPRDVRRAEEADVKKYGVPIGTPMIAADLLEVSVVTIGSNPNVGPGRAAAVAEARAIAQFRTGAGEALLDRAALERVYSKEIVAEAVPAPAADAAPDAVAKSVEWADLERCAGLVDEAVRQWQPTTAAIEDVETARTFAPSGAPADPPEDPIDAMLRSLDALILGDEADGAKPNATAPPVPPAESGVAAIEVNGLRYVSEGDAKIARRRALLRDVAARCLAEAQAAEPAELHTLLQIPEGQLEPIHAALETLRGQVLELRGLLVALDPTGSSAGRPLADKMLGTTELIEGLRATAVATAGGDKPGK